jgi:hypothetical protein
VWTVGLLLVVQGAFLLANHFEQERRQTLKTAKDLYCHDCGDRNIEGSLFCKACGKELSQAALAFVVPTQEMVNINQDPLVV